MKPIKLTMRAFGPYKNEEVIDFEKLHQSRLFVISGTTGAGKSTIFDGICFALFGQGSGSDRKDVKMLRSDFAEDDIYTAVELLFEIHGKKYRVLRQIAHVKKGKKTATGENYELFEILENGEEVAAVERQKVTDINKKLEEIIGLTYDQFSQIVMLPQGEFRKLLTSQTENKEEILRKIFKTNRYGDMAVRLEVKKQQAEQKLNEARVLKNSYIAQLSGALPKRDSYLFSLLDKNSNIYQIQDAINEELVYYQQKIIEDEKLYEEAFNNHKEKYDLYLSNKALNDRIDAFEQKVLKLQEIEKQKPIYEKIKREYDEAIKASRIDPVYKNQLTLDQEKQVQQLKFTKGKEQLESSKEKLIKSKSFYENELQNQELREKATKKVLDLEELVPLFEEIEKQKQIVQKLQIDTDQVKERFVKLEQQYSHKKTIKASMNHLIEELELKTKDLHTFMEEQNGLREIVQAFNRYNDTLLKLDELNEKYHLAHEKYEDAKRVYDIEESKWFNNQAVLIAAKLVPGEPCPVCGSKDHHLTEREVIDLVDEEKLKQLKAKLSDKELQKLESLAKVNAMQVQLDQVRAEIESLNANVEEQNTYLLKFNELNEKIKNIRQDHEILSQQRIQLKNVLIEEQQLEAVRNQCEQQYREKSNQLLQQKTILEQQQLTLPNEIQSLNVLKEAIRDAKNIKDELNKKWEYAQKIYQDTQTEVATNEETFKLATELLKEITIKLENAKEEFNHGLISFGFENVNQYLIAKRSESEQQYLYEQFMNYSKALHSLTEQVNEEKEHLKDKQKIDLTETEDQMNMLKVVYEKALHTLNESKNYERVCLDYTEKLQSIVEKIHSLEETSNQIVDLYNLLRGQNSKKISFERYVQMGYLEQITEAANIRLRKLSNGQFYLQCSDRQESHGRQSGLSLDVYDTYTGQSRDVKSLSGGEKFNASLCLALGMADVIQSYEGNVRIDTMFIDEGFGSLDEESLMKAIDTLIDLQKSGRMIGVISHVAELKAAMPAILQVEKLKEGYSRTSIIVK